MAMLDRDNGSQNVILRFMLLDNTSTVGGALTTLTNSTTGLKIATIADVEATATVYSSAGTTIDTVATLGTYAAPTATHCNFKAVDTTNLPGLYELQLSNARFAVTGATDLTVIIQASGGNCSPQGFKIDLDAQVDVVANGGVTATSSGGIQSVNITQIAGNITRATKFANEMDGRFVGTVTTASFTPTTTQAEFSDITDVAAFSVYINRGFLVLTGALIKMGGVILGDVVGTAGRRLTFSAMPQAFANGDTIQIM